MFSQAYFCPQGGGMLGGGGMCMAGGGCMARGHACQGVYMAGRVLGRGEGMHGRRDGH